MFVASRGDGSNKHASRDNTRQVAALDPPSSLHENTGRWNVIDGGNEEAADKREVYEKEEGEWEKREEG